MPDATSLLNDISQHFPNTVSSCIQTQNANASGPFSEGVWGKSTAKKLNALHSLNQEFFLRVQSDGTSASEVSDEEEVNPDDVYEGQMYYSAMNYGDAMQPQEVPIPRPPDTLADDHNNNWVVYAGNLLSRLLCKKGLTQFIAVMQNTRNETSDAKQQVKDAFGLYRLPLDPFVAEYAIKQLQVQFIKKVQEKLIATAVAQGSHLRLGQESQISLLSPELLQLICSYGVIDNDPA